jgi:glycosyltransferase involved in cell wall biosynthesis
VRADSRRIHLLEVGLRWPPETFVGWKLEALARRGFRVTLASKRVFDPEARLDGVDLIELQRPPRAAFWAAARGLSALVVVAPRRAARLVRAVWRMDSEDRRRLGGALGTLAAYLPLVRARPDVVQFEWITAVPEHLPLFDVWRCPVAIACRGSDTSVYPFDPLRWRYVSRLPEILSRVSAAHCISENQLREAVELGLDRRKGRVIRPGVDSTRFANSMPREPSPGDPVRIVSVGGLRWMKGYEYAALAMRVLLDRGVPVVLEIVGDVPSPDMGEGERGRILQAAADLALGDHLQLAGGLDEPAVARRLAQADIYLQASVSEGLPAAVIEAKAAGLPVVACDAGGTREGIREGIDGFVVPPRDPERIADALERLARDAALRRRMGAAGRAHATTEFTLDAETDGFAAFYSELLTT